MENIIFMKVINMSFTKHKDHNIFIRAIHQCKIVTLIFTDKTTSENKTRNCIPFDYGNSTKETNPKPKYHFYDLNSPEGSHNLSISEKQIINIEILDKDFEQKEYITWKPN